MSPAAQYALSIPLSTAPAIVLLWLFRQFDRTRPVPRRALYITMGLGALACGPAAVIEYALHALLGDVALIGGRFLDAFLVAALTEEALKLLVVVAWPYRRSVFVEVIDGVVYTVAASLGFGLLENLAYSAADVGTAVARALTAVPMHAIASGIMGYFVGRARFVPSHNALPLWMAGLFCGVAIHGGYDWAVYHRDGSWFAESIGVLVGGAALLALLVRQAIQFDDAMLGRHSMTAFMQAEWPKDVQTTLVPSTVEPDRSGDADSANKG